MNIKLAQKIFYSASAFDMTQGFQKSIQNKPLRFGTAGDFACIAFAY